MKRYIALFVLIELVNLLLFVPGLLMCISLSYYATLIPPLWLWWNSVDPPKAGQFWRNYYWLALRNPVSNLRLVPGVSKIGRPLWRKTWGARPGGWYAQAGWNASGYPVLSAGRNINTF